MKALSMMLAPAIFAFAGSCAVCAEERDVPIAVNVAGLQPHVAAQVTKHAEQGVTALSRYLERTRKQNGLYLEDVTRKPVVQATGGEQTPPKRYRTTHASQWR